MKIYLKKGNLSYKERRMVEQLTKSLEQRTKLDPNFSIQPAENISDLQKLWTEYCVDEVEYSEVPKGNSEVEPVYSDNNEPIAEKQETTEPTQNNDYDEEDDWDDASSNSDPFNRDEPIVRDYVKGSDFPDDKVKVDAKNNYDEPRTQRDQMRIPGSEEDIQNNTNKTGSNNNSQGNNNSGSPKNSASGGSSAPMNPKFNEMSDSQKKKQTTRMAKSIVRLVCTLAEKGFEWWGNKGITEEEIAQLEATDQIDTDLEVMSMIGPGQVVTIKNFFAQQRIAVSEISKISEEEKQMLVESLVEVMIEKGIGPTPMQNLLLNILEVVVVRGLAIYGIQKQNANILAQLIEMKEIQKKQNPDKYAENYTEWEARANQIRQEYSNPEPETQTTLTKVEPVTTE